MRLLNSSTYQLHEFNEPEKPYAIFSHTWGNDEVSLQDYQESIAENRNGFEKIKCCCDQAAEDDIPWVWVDTCCMNQLDNAETIQVLHSSYEWLENAEVCYAYLVGVSSSADKLDSTLRGCKWFTRKFTLQELVAPPEVVFLAEDWTIIGTRKSLHGIISEITGIQSAVLTGEKKPKQCHVSERMAWASNREAKAVEDEAYALMGLFDIKLPILYGEGNRAFRRLQDEIRKTHYDTARTGIRLLITKSEPLELKYFSASDSPEYAILSHTWAVKPEEEISFWDVRQGKATSKGSYQKVKRCCRLAAEHGFKYLWVDTCCIDKSSSAELQEAICSMYRWYKQAQICYVYLEDYFHDLATSVNPNLWNCKWFKRGWTLQELIAPTFVEFYDKEWNEIGTKFSLCEHISQITSIDPNVLRGSDPTKRTISERMSWAASRSTTRIEDAAYSLMGLFNVNMPMLYGEGSRAFIRLQEEIMKESEDYTIFAWKASFLSGSHRGLLAHSPDEFLGCTNIVSGYNYTDYHEDHPPTLTSRGLRISLLVERSRDDPRKYLACVSLKHEHKESSWRGQEMLCIWLELMPTNIFVRISPDELVRLPYNSHHRFTMKTVYVKPHGTESGGEAFDLDNIRSGMMQIRYEIGFAAYFLKIKGNFSEVSIWRNVNPEEPAELLYSYDKESCILAALSLEKDEEQSVICIGFQDHLPWCSVVSSKELGYPSEQSLDESDFTEKLLRHFKWPYSDQTDRSSRRLSNGSIVTAALRVGCPTKLNPTVFNLHIRHELPGHNTQNV